MSNLASRLKTRLAQANLAVAAARQEISRQERIAKKDKSVVPPYQMEKLMAEVNYCRDEVASVEASLAGVSKYPPIAFSRNPGVN